MTAEQLLSRLVTAVTELRDEYAEHGAAQFNGLQVGDSLDDLLRTTLDHEVVTGRACAATLASGRQCSITPTGSVGSVELCHRHLEATIEAAPFTDHGRQVSARLQREADEIRRAVHAEHAEARRQVEALRKRRDRLAAEVTRLQKLVNERRPIATKVRRAVIERHERTCSYCRRTGTVTKGWDGRSWHIDHDLPIVRGGTNDEANLVLACASCNLSKRDMTGDEFRQLIAPLVGVAS